MAKQVSSPKFGVLFVCFVFMNRSQNINILSALNFFLTQETKLIKYLRGGRERKFFQVCPKSVGPPCHLWVLIQIKSELWTQQRTCIFTFKEERASMTQADRLWEGQLATSIWYTGSALEMAHSFSSGKGEELGSRSVNKKRKKEMKTNSWPQIQLSSG